MCNDADAAWLFAAFTGSPIRRDVKISRGTHLLHLEASRYALYRETQTSSQARTNRRGRREPIRRTRCLP